MHQFEVFIVRKLLIISQKYSNVIIPLAYFEPTWDNITKVTVPKQTAPAVDVGKLPLPAQPFRGLDCKAPRPPEVCGTQRPLCHCRVTPVVFYWGQQRSDKLSTLLRSGRSFHKNLLDIIFPLVIPMSVCLDPRGMTSGLVPIGQLSSSRHLKFGVILPLSPRILFSFPCQFNS